MEQIVQTLQVGVSWAVTASIFLMGAMMAVALLGYVINR